MSPDPCMTREFHHPPYKSRVIALSDPAVSHQIPESIPLGIHTTGVPFLRFSMHFLAPAFSRSTSFASRQRYYDFSSAILRNLESL